MSASVAGASGPAHVPSVAVGLFREGSASPEVSGGGSPLFVPEELGSGAGFSSGRASRAPSPPLASSAGGTSASSCPPSRASSGPSSPSGRGMSARGGCGGARSRGHGRGRGGDGHGGSAGLLEPPSSLTMLAVERRVCMEANAPGVVLLHHTDFSLGEGMALPEADFLGLVAVSSVTLCANVVIAVGVPAAMGGLLYVRCLHHWREAPFSACCILVGGMACIRCCHIMQQVCRPVS